MKEAKKKIGGILVHTDSENVNTHSERSCEAIKQSMDELGVGRFIVANKAGKILAGNASFAQAVELGIEMEVVKTHGNKMLIHVREDIEEGDPKGTLLEIADNKTAQLSTFDLPRLADIFLELVAADIDITPSGFTLPEIEPFLHGNFNPGLPDPNASTGPQSGADKSVVCPECGHIFEPE